MFFDRYIGFLDELLVKVEVVTISGSFVGNGELSVKNNSAPQINFGFCKDISKFSNQKSFICRSEKYTYQLLSCEVLESAIISNFMIRGDTRRRKFREVHLLIQGVSQWIDTDGKFEITENEIIKTRESKLFNAEIEIKDRKFSLSNERLCWAKKLGENNSQLYEYTLLKLKAIDFSWSSEELIEVINRTKIFFNLILGHPVGIEYVLDLSVKNKHLSIYFPNSTRDEWKEVLQNKCFARSNLFFIENRWQNLLQGYFDISKDRYKNLWSRISGMLMYEGFWEYRILGYVSLLDRYVTLYSEGEKKSLSENQFKKHRRAVRSTLESIKSDTTIEDKDQREALIAVLDSMCRQINESIKNTSIATFNEKFDFAISKTDKNILKIIDFSDEDFNLLKNIRNKVAHGDEPSIRNGSDITYEITITNKLALLLRYWVFADIGFSYTEIIDCFKNWMYPITQGARLHRDSLNITSGDFHFFKVNKTNYSRAKNHKAGCLVLDYVKTSDSLRINQKATKQASVWTANTNNKHRSVEEELMAFVDTQKVKSIAYLSNLYLEYETEKIGITGGACIFNCPDYLLSDQRIKDRFRLFDSEVGEWLPSEFENKIRLAKAKK